MSKTLITPLLLISLLCFGCSKSSQPGPKGGETTGSVKIELVSGNNQTDTIGYHLPNFIVVKVTQNGQPLKNYTVLYKGSGCNEERMDKFDTGADGTAGYNWFLAGDVGQQTLKIYAVDDENNKVDSVTAVSTAIAPGSGGWHYSACTYPFGFMVTALCKTGSGRLFTTLSGGPSYLRYSDDNGVGWYSVKSLGNTHRFERVAASSANEVFAVADDANFYSADNGGTWTSLPVQTFNNNTISGLTFTASGKVVAASQGLGVYISSDKGKTWTIAPASLFVHPNSTGHDSDFAYPSEDLNGNLYILSKESGVIYKSTDAGKSWTYLNFPNDRFESLFIDANNWFYASVNGSEPYGIYISKDNAATFNLLSNSVSGFNDQISIQSDGNLYYTLSSVSIGGLYRLNGIGTPAKWLFNDGAPYNIPYIVAKNNNIVIASSMEGSLSYRN
ncbi:MAG TPA: hypothetical protein VL442_14825 [Mucilaginibacter sp.]|jgi:hypothetical protein|nr:hypothetical protein [Mucilaginibacter sp.]